MKQIFYSQVKDCAIRIMNDFYTCYEACTSVLDRIEGKWYYFYVNGDYAVVMNNLEDFIEGNEYWCLFWKKTVHYP